MVDTPAENAVSGPFLYFTFICLALNSMAQPSGRVCDMPYNLRFLLRSSPIFCCFDGLGVAFMWVNGRVRNKDSVVRAAARIAKMRFRGTESDSDSFSKMESDSGFRLGMFVFGVVPQIVKLFACRGVAWMQVLGALYLGPWLLLEVLALCAGRGPGMDGEVLEDQSHDLDMQSRDERKCKWMAMWSTMAVWTHCSMFDSYNLVTVGPEGSPGGFWVCRIFVICFSAAYMMGLASEEYAALNYRYPDPDSHPDDSQASPGTVRAAGAFHIFSSSIALMMVDELGVTDSWLFATLFTVVVCFVMLFNPVITPLLAGYVDILGVSLPYPLLEYDPFGTHKPKWTEFLG